MERKLVRWCGDSIFRVNSFIGMRWTLPLPVYKVHCEGPLKID